MFHTTRDAARELGMQLRMVQRHIKQGHMKAEKRGGRDYLITDAELKRFKRERRSVGRPPKKEAL